MNNSFGSFPAIGNPYPGLGNNNWTAPGANPSWGAQAPNWNPNANIPANNTLVPPVNTSANNSMVPPVPNMQEMQKAFQVYQWIQNSGLTGEEIEALAKVKKDGKPVDEFLEIQRPSVNSQETDTLKTTLNNYIESTDKKLTNLENTLGKISQYIESFAAPADTTGTVKSTKSTSSSK